MVGKEEARRKARIMVSKKRMREKGTITTMMM